MRKAKDFFNNKKEVLQFKKWMKALRSGEYSQTRGALQDGRGYCCLGVACEVLIPDKLKERGALGWLSGGMPSCQSHGPIWLKEINLDLSLLLSSPLAEMNDSKKMTFDEIADVLEAVYLHGALDA
jgi:hypothetical protein